MTTHLPEHMYLMGEREAELEEAQIGGEAMKKRKGHYLVGNQYEGCGHKHRTRETARHCLARLRRRGASHGEYSVWIIFTNDGRRYRRLKGD